VRCRGAHQCSIVAPGRKIQHTKGSDGTVVMASRIEVMHAPPPRHAPVHGGGGTCCIHQISYITSLLVRHSGPLLGLPSAQGKPAKPSSTDRLTCDAEWSPRACSRGSWPPTQQGTGSTRCVPCEKHRKREVGDHTGRGEVSVLAHDSQAAPSHRTVNKPFFAVSNQISSSVSCNLTPSCPRSTPKPQHRSTDTFHALARTHSRRPAVNAVPTKPESHSRPMKTACTLTVRTRQTASSGTRKALHTVATCPGGSAASEARVENVSQPPL